MSFHDPKMSILECILSRGDRRLAAVIEEAFKRGARFEAWGNHFNFGIWEESFNALGIDWSRYLNNLPTSDALPWDFIDTGVSNADLLEEFHNSIAM